MTVIVVALSDCPPKVKGDLSKWLMEINTGVYVGHVNARVRDELWDRICENIKNGRASMVYSANNEQGLQFRVHNTTWEPADYDGITLMRRPSMANGSGENPPSLPPGKVEQILRARRMQIARLHLPDSYAALDIETTGLSPQKDAIIEIAVICVDKGKIVSRWSQFVQCDRKIPEDIVALTGITNQMVQATGIPSKQALIQVLSLIGEKPIVSHNAAFDVGFLRAACIREGVDLPRNRVIDTLDIARKHIRGLANYSLSAVAAHFQIPADEAHRALNDCEMLVRVYTKLNEN